MDGWIADISVRESKNSDLLHPYVSFGATLGTAFVFQMKGSLRGFKNEGMLLVLITDNFSDFHSAQNPPLSSCYPPQRVSTSVG